MYKGVFSIFSRYWVAYGGWRALFRSPYLHFAALMMLPTAPFWLYRTWFDQVISVVPSLLGFSLGGLAMFLSFGDEKFKTLMAARGSSASVSLYMGICSSFVHFIMVQIIALVCAVVFKSLAFDLPGTYCFSGYLVLGGYAFSMFAYLLFLYSITSMAAATMAVFRLTSIYAVYQEKLAQQAQQSGTGP
jgi:uncharacterized membrane protein